MTLPLPRPAQASPAILGALAACMLGHAAVAQVDLSLSGLSFNQGNNFTTTTLVGDCATMVRARFAVGGTTAVPGTDAILRVYANGVEIPGSPFFSVNGPITAPVTPNLGTIDHTVNFLLVPPQGALAFVVEVDPANVVAETNEANNVASPFNRTFLCRRAVDFAYVPVNYTPGGGVPATTYTDPGIGDGFLRGIYPVGEWNYHRTPFPPLTWTTNINSSNDALLAELLDIRQTDMVAAGYARPDFIYGWLPGNPFSGNGQAAGIPSFAAFGNTEVSRFQRTLAHEIGHCFGLVHTSNTLLQVGIDVEHHLRNPLNLAVLHATGQSDVMVAGLLTNQAWVNQSTINTALSDSRTLCTAGFAGGGDAPVVRIAASWNQETGTADLEPIQRFPSGEVTPQAADGDVDLRFLDPRGRAVGTWRVQSGHDRESCASEPGHAIHHATSLIYAAAPDSIMRGAARVELVDTATRALIGAVDASAHAPAVERLSASLAVGVPSAPGQLGTPGAPEACLRIEWSASDRDGDDVRTTILYSPDMGDRWVPIVHRAGATGTAMVPLASIPAARDSALVMARVQDGFHVAESAFTLQAQMVGNPPDVHIISPNASSAHAEWGSVLLHASGWDLEDEYLPDGAFAWSSDIDGALGIGREFSVKSLTPGTHTITLVGTDAEGLSTTVVTVITVNPRAVVPGDLDGDAKVRGSDLGFMLAAWGTSGRGDLDGTGDVGGGDLAILLGNWSP